MKKLFLNKGWAGKTISRAETVQQFNPIVVKHIALNRHYDAAIRDLDDADLQTQFLADQRTARVDVGKLSETIFSCGGVAYTGVDIEPSLVSVGDSADSILFKLLDMEEDLLSAVKSEESVEHQMRSRAILGVVETHSAERYKILSNATRKLHRQE